MESNAYVLIETAVGETASVKEQLGQLTAVQSVDTVTGPFDIIAVVVADDLDSLGDVVTDNVHRIRGISHTLTCFILDGK